MPVTEIPTTGVRYFHFESLDAAGLVHAVFMRQGGVSEGPWTSLNVGSTVGDNPYNVLENKRRSFAALDRDPESLFDVWQVHGRAVVRGEAPRPPHVPHRRADAIITRTPGVTLFMRFADCVPIFLYDPVRKAAGLVHAGWRGTVQDASGAALEAMQEHYGSRPEDILAAIGPSIGPDHYEVGPEVAEQVQQAFGEHAAALLCGENGRTHLDLWQANRLRLEQHGVRHIELAGICTACNTADWFSHRAEAGRTGRFGALLALP
jgi:YfiH family protein